MIRLRFPPTTLVALATAAPLALTALAGAQCTGPNGVIHVAIMTDDYPTRAQLAKTGLKRNQTLLGLYEGVPLTRRGRHYGMVPPDKITIFQKPIESKCRNDDEITAEVQRVVEHEIAHHFGIGEARLRQIEKAKYRRKGKVQD